MNNDIEYPNNPRNGKALAGIILLVIGLVLLLRQFTFFFIPGWLFSWPMWLIFWGLVVGARSNFHKPSSFVLILLGVVFLIDNNIHGASGIVWPVGIIAFGLWMILRRRHGDHTFIQNKYGHKWDWRAHTDPGTSEPVVDYTASALPPEEPRAAYPPTGDDYLDTVAVFGSVKKTILSKNFMGGEIVNVFGGAELDFTQADIKGRVVIDATQIFGSIKIIVPSHWQVVPDIAAVFAGIEDKRMKGTAAPGNDKVLVLKGVSIFAGVDIRSY